MATSVPLRIPIVQDRDILTAMQNIANTRRPFYRGRKRKISSYSRRQPSSAHKLATAALLLVVPFCDPGILFERPALPFGTTDELVVLVRNGPTTRFLGADGKFSGIEQDMLEMFAKDLGVRLRVIERSNFADILPSLHRNFAHLAAAGLNATDAQRSRLIFGPAYLSVQKVVAYNTEGPRPRSVLDLAGKRVAVVAGSSSADQLRLERANVPDLLWDEVPVADSMTLLDQLSDGEYDFVVTDSNIVELAQNFSPNIGRAFTLGGPETLAWALPNDADPIWSIRYTISSNASMPTARCASCWTGITDISNA